jgi:hypothetical protein
LTKNAISGSVSGSAWKPMRIHNPDILDIFYDIWYFLSILC